jgi:predicted phosphohydrolase
LHFSEGRIILKVVVVGDLHGDWSALNTLISRKNPDIILQCGDFGWWPAMERGKWKLKGIKTKKTKVYFCDGNHEDHPNLMSFVKDYNTPCEMYENVFYCPRGMTMQIDGLGTVLFAGGADSIDKIYRTVGFDWFPEELLSLKDEYRLLDACKSDIVISHTCPNEVDIIRPEMSYNNGDPTRKVLSEVLFKHKPNKWFFGHWHRQYYAEKEFFCDDGSRFCTEFVGLDYPGNLRKWWIELK